MYRYTTLDGERRHKHPVANHNLLLDIQSCSFLHLSCFGAPSSSAVCEQIAYAALPRVRRGVDPRSLKRRIVPRAAPQSAIWLQSICVQGCQIGRGICNAAWRPDSGGQPIKTPQCNSIGWCFGAPFFRDPKVVERAYRVVELSLTLGSGSSTRGWHAPSPKHVLYTGPAYWDVRNVSC